MEIIKHRKIYFIISGALVAASIISLLLWKLNPAIDFTGGSLLEIEYKEQRPENNEIRKVLEELELGEATIQPSGERGAILRFKDVNEKTHQQIIQKLKDQSDFNEKRFDSIGPVIGAELKEKAFKAMGWVLVLILGYVAWAFRKVSKIVASWKYGLIAIITLFHDILIVMGVYSVLGYFYGVEIGLPFVAALLTILGYSVNDTIVVFDRTRENLLKSWGESFENTINKSVNQTITRSINTSLTTLLVLFAIYFFGGETIRWFVLALILGVSVGTYSSIFIASPLLVVLEKIRKR